MTYLSGLMLGASLANMLRQTLGARDAGAFAAQGTRGGRRGVLPHSFVITRRQDRVEKTPA